jgi:hypothetical protein
MLDTPSTACGWTGGRRGGQPELSGDNSRHTCGLSCGRRRSSKNLRQTPCGSCPSATRNLPVTGNGDRPGGRPPGRGGQRETAVRLGSTGTGDGSEVWTGERSSAPLRWPAPRRRVLSDQGTTRRGSPVLAGSERSGQSRRDRSHPGAEPEQSGAATRWGSSTQVPDPSDRDRRARWGSSTEVPGPSDRARSPTEGIRSAQAVVPSDRSRRPRGASSTQAAGPSDRDCRPRGSTRPATAGAEQSGLVTTRGSSAKAGGHLGDRRARRAGGAPPSHAWRGFRRSRGQMAGVRVAHRHAAPPPGGDDGGRRACVSLTGTQLRHPGVTMAGGGRACRSPARRPATRGGGGRPG